MSISGLWLVIGWLALGEAAIVVTAPRIPVRPIAWRSVGGARPAEDVWTLLQCCSARWAFRQCKPARK